MKKKILKDHKDECPECLSGMCNRILFYEYNLQTGTNREEVFR